MRIAMVRTDKARNVEDWLIQAVQAGRVRGGTGPGGQISESDLIGLLEQVSRQQADAAPKITVPHFHS